MTNHEQPIAMPYSIIPTPFIELILNDTESPHAEQAIEELNRLRAVQCHLVTHLHATKLQTDACISVVEPLIESVQPLCDPPAHLLGGSLK
ncbi:hypothetical protein UFOVP653_5 [uncultured Caudovirales phage]|uniref:Uncharacterized protein n=1 Tax=uncultured Caudovirales phage TaxID=2100421 RepID=A0A6J5N8Y7_9CAUD|nr:hypothetical protein UFOVP653_5 [uncultured Caudovirales phage]